MSNLRYILLFVLSLLTYNLAFSQLELYDSVKVSGTIEVNNRNLRNSFVSIYKDSKLVKKIELEDGKYELELPIQNVFILALGKPGYATKRVLVDTHIPEEEIEYGFDPVSVPDVEIFEQFPGLNLSDLSKPVYRIFYDIEIGTYVLDEKFQGPDIQKVLTQLSRLKQDAYLATIKEADELMTEQQLEDAWTKYESAMDILPDKDYPKKKIGQIKKELKVEESREKIYSKIIKKADDAYLEKDYPEASKYYQQAQLYKPDDPFAQKRMDKIERMYNAYLNEGDTYANKGDVSKALTKYEYAQQIFPDRQYAQSQINNLMSSASGDVLYEREIDNADAAYKQADFSSALEHYNEALEYKKNDEYALGQIDKINKGVENEKKYQRLLEDGKAYEEQNNVKEAIDAYTEAISIHPENPELKTKIDALKVKLENLNRENEEKQKEARYKQLINKGDIAFASKEYMQAKKHYKDAIDVKSKDYPRQRIKEIEKLMAEQDEVVDSVPDDIKVTADNAQDSADANVNNPDLQINKDIDDQTLDGRIDYFKKMIALAEEEDNKVEMANLYEQLGKEYKQKKDEKLALENLNKALKLFEESKNKSKQSEVYHNIGLVYHKGNKKEKALENYKKALDLKESIGEKQGVSDIMSSTAMVMYDSGRYENSIDFLEKALSYEKELGNKEKEADILNKLGKMLEGTYRFDKSIDCFTEAVKIQEDKGDTIEAAMAYNNIGDVYVEQKNYDKAIEFYEKSLEKDKLLGKEKDMAAGYNNIGIIYYEKGDFETSMSYYEKSVNLLEKLNQQQQLAQSYNNMGNVNYDWTKYKEAIDYYTKSLKIKEGLKMEKGVANSLFNIANVHKTLGEMLKAKDFYLRSNEIAERIKYAELIKANYEALAEVYSSMEDFKIAMEYYKKLSEKLHPAKVKRQISEKQLKYTDRENEEIAFLREELEKQKILVKFETSNKEMMMKLKDAEIERQEEILMRQRILLGSFVFGFIVILIFSVIIYRQSQQRKRANQKLAMQNEEIQQQKEEIEAQRDEIEYQRDFVVEQKDLIEEQKKEITDSIVYASIIQSAILPPARIITQAALDHFVLYKPRDIVSGDFYWFTVLDNKMVIVAADCTGHGVPGAFMSMLGIATLNEVVNKDKNLVASDILNELRKGIISSLHQTEEEIEAKDGMDISLCVLDTNKKHMQFAGAYNPALVLRNNEIEKIKADPMPIGIHRNMNNSFTDNEYDLQEGDVVYIFSDGYADQFGGPKGKKLKIKKFKEYLLEIHQKPMEEQKAILDERFEEWKGNTEQIDDVLVVGFRV